MPRHGPGRIWWGLLVGLVLAAEAAAIALLTKGGQVGDHLFGEKAYIILSLTAKSLLACWVFSAVLLSSGK